MVSLMEEQKFDCVIDTTHPYATAVSENIQSACKRSDCPYLRVIRDGIKEEAQEDFLKNQDCLFFDSHEAVVDYLNGKKGRVLLTVGSKELHKYTKVDGCEDRIFPRVLPMLEVMESCYELGFAGKQLICMQGPFSRDLNSAMMKQIGAEYLVTKDSGDYGGFMEKYQAAKQVGATLLVIGRSRKDTGVSLHEAIALLREKTGLALEAFKEEEPLFPQSSDCTEEKLIYKAGGEIEPGQWFPFFINISEKKVVVIGGGRIALRRILALMNFDCRVKVVSMEALPEVMKLAEDGRLSLELKAFENKDIEGAHYALAATNNHEINLQIYEACKHLEIPVNVASNKEKSDFYFPGIIRKNGITVGVTAEGKNHRLAKLATKAIKKCLDRNLEEDGEDEENAD